jgi:myo-inositol-1(or 4)-monophosphatase
LPAPEADPALPGPDHAGDLALLTEAALAAGEIARRHFGRGPASWDKGAGQGPVSEADLEIDLMLRDRLLAARPGFGWLSEETEDAPERLAAEAVFIVDPIDGTRAFLEGQKGFAHALAIARGGKVTASVVHLPLLERTYAARRGAGAYVNDRPLLTPPRKGLIGARVLASRGQLDPQLWPGGLPAVERHFRPSLAWRICLVAEGAFDGTVTLRDTWDWDTAAAALIAEEAGARITDRHGAELAFNTPAPRSPGLIVGPEGVHSGFLAGLRGPAAAAEAGRRD